MYLKKIYMQGFKSFADKTEIKFNNDISAIIGPNGSGKSNISDAVRWVLGEQSIKNLRGSKMEDIIFSGTDKRKALGFAEVSIVIDNSSQKIPLDYNEVSITRRMFRSGESEYFINKSPCRLKDIRELLMDTGVGKEGYSIIGQGRIDEILSTKPVDRRGIFEEAAGIVKFKSKKTESERKLLKTQNNIYRIEDLLHEIENQRKQVEKEAKRTEEFNKLFIQLKELEVNQFIGDINKFEIELDKLKTEEDKIKDNIEELMDHKKLIEDRYDILKEEIKNKEEAIEESRNIKFTAIQDFEKNKNQLSLLKEKESYLYNEINRLGDYNRDIKDRLEDLEKQKKLLEKELEEGKKHLDDLLLLSQSKEEDLRKFREKIEAMDMALEKEKEDLLSTYDIVSNKRSERNSANNFIETIKTRINDIKDEIEEIYENRKRIEGQVARLSNDYDNLNKELNHKKEELDSYNNTFKKLTLEFEEIAESLNRSKLKLNGLNSSYRLLNNMENDYDGYYNSVKKFLKVLTNNNKLKDGFTGLVADLIRVKNEYIKAIEVTLAGNAQNIVVENDQVAKAMIKYLKNNRIGRVTFLPKNTIKGNTINLNTNIKEQYNIVGTASQLIDYDKSLENIINYLLGRTIVIKDMDSAIRYSKASNYRYRIVTLDGEVFNPGGSITGGSIPDNRISILSRKNKLNDLRKDIDTEEKNLNILEASKEAMTIKLNELQGKMDNLSKEEEELKLSLSNIKNEINNSNAYNNRLKEDLARKTKEIDTLSSEHNILLKNQEDIIKSIEEMEEKERSIKRSIEAQNKLLKDEKLQEGHLSSEHTKLTIEINSQVNRIDNLKDKLNNTSKEIQGLLETSVRNRDEIEKIKEDISNLGEKKENINLYQEEHNLKEVELSKKLNDLIKKKEDLMQTFYGEQDNLKIINEEISKLEKKINSIQVKIARYEVESTTILNKLKDQYDLEYSQALKYEKDLSHHKDLKDRVRQLKEDIRDLGNVNVNALEEFKAIDERFQFMNKQYEDLIESREDLKLIIKDMDKHMKTLFIKNFQEINMNFQEVFKILFDGGFAELELEDESNVLESGIDIKVQPPGKKLQYLNLLSGGEKSLTAVALLFAILRTKPAPFCILDEIDAALDESNINRYIKYLKSFSESTQFILITHRKTTMEIADVLYGVTMEERGVSKLISVKLKDEVAAS